MRFIPRLHKTVAQIIDRLSAAPGPNDNELRADGGEDVLTALRRKYPDKVLHDCPEFPDVDGVALKPGATCEGCGHEADAATAVGSWATDGGAHHKIVAETDREWSACGRTLNPDDVTGRRLFALPSLDEMCDECATVLVDHRAEEVEQ